MLTPFRCGIACGLFVLATLLLPPAPAHAQGAKNEPTAQEAQVLIDKALSFLKTQQAADGSFSAKRFGPGISALVVAALLRNGQSPKEPLIARTLAYLEKSVKQDGGVYDKYLANYTTCIALMAFREANTNGKYDTIIKNAGTFIKGLQVEESTTDLSKLNAGGFPYGKDEGKPDASNTAFAIEAMIAAGVDKNDPAIKKALEFMSKCQNLPGEYNPLGFAKKATADDKGGLTYTPDTKDNQYATAEGGLRSLGGMTYGGLKSFLYAGVKKDDPRVQAAIDWIRKHYTLEENPGLKQSGLYYYYHVFAKAMEALGEEPFVDAKGAKHFWKRELFDALAKRQQADGSWRNAGDKTFGEGEPTLATAFAILSLSYCYAPKK
jgi:squalene-hopene/tetraprenyl-beta-curcumene cyclase